MATFVLVHGGTHGGWSYQRLARHLEAAGHRVYRPTLTGLGERRHLLNSSINLETHIEDVVSMLFHEDLNDIYLAGHSYGGMVITGIADRALERIRHMIFLDAAHPRNGEALTDIAPGMMDMAFRYKKQVNGVDVIEFPKDVAIAAFGLTNPEDFVWAAPRIAPQICACFMSKLHLDREDEILRLPRTSINCTETLGNRPPELVNRALEADHVHEIDTGHALMISEPRKVADMLLEVVANEESRAPRR